jgi:LmbE family N-acetylglucosaminyl deacetylase
MDALYDRGFHNCAVIVAHPDDETLWAGGTILMNPRLEWTIITICRADDPDRAQRFYRTLELLGAHGAMGDLDDGPRQPPLSPDRVEQTILSLLPRHTFDLVITHNPRGEYTRHRRHEETARAVAALLADGRLTADHALTFAYEDAAGSYLPRPIPNPDFLLDLPEDVWQKKYRIVTDAYGFTPDSFEARTTPRQEAFRRLRINDTSIMRQHHENTRTL